MSENNEDFNEIDIGKIPMVEPLPYGFAIAPIIKLKRSERTTLPNGQYTNCEGCPCRNMDNEYGSDCNLNFDIQSEMIFDDEHYDLSANCLLQKIHYMEEKEINGVVTKIKRVYSQNKVMLTD